MGGAVLIAMVFIGIIILGIVMPGRGGESIPPTDRSGGETPHPDGD